MAKQKATLGPILLVAFIDMLGFGTIIPIVRDYTIFLTKASGWNLANVTLYSGILMSTYSIFQFLFSPWLGRLSDKIGRRPVLLISVGGNVLSYLLWAFSQSFEVFLVSRILSGATGANISVAQSYISDITDKSNRAKSMGLMGALFGLGFILGPFFGALLSKVDLSRVSILGFAMNPFSLVGIFTMTLSLVNLLWIALVLTEPDRVRTGVEKVINPVALFREFLRPNLGLLFLVFFLISISFVHLEATLAWDLLNRFSMDTSDTGYFFAYMGIVMVFVQGGLYRGLLKRFSERDLAVAGLLITSLSLGFFPYTPNYALMTTAVGFMALGMGIGNPSLTALGSFYSSEQEQGFVLGIMQSFGSLARVIAPLTATFFYDHVGHHVPFVVAAGLAMLAFFFSLKLPKKD